MATLPHSTHEDQSTVVDNYSGVISTTLEAENNGGAVAIANNHEWIQKLVMPYYLKNSLATAQL